ncbi:sigma-70 family RNA polymerase sigma factor [Petropleomorpha daqingensis]|uniref:RNA polymerase sigma-70 factor (ECF subfamily) n=1 Tax=Petropleomorpha daqingensis TaxID=2026353 RepID=A0A853CCY5_9ACTN|nr:sigma-70 family RNA polymerase sigma factor [Petropleomorpha daqingensis]NYJ04896.1 RNA polymerase sigma-70 factor (ECF subfamily) [Petropleomorpha daqingensis]
MPSPRPLDAARQATAAPAESNGRPTPYPRPSPAARPSPRPRPTPFPRAATETVPAPRPEPSPDPPLEPNVVVDPALDEELTADEFAALADAGEPPESDGVDVWGLVRAAQAGDAEAFGRLYDHYVTMIFRYVYHRVGDRAMAEDVTSETFVRALRRIDSLSFQGRDVGAWLVTIARNIIRDHVKSSRYRLEVTTADMRDADRATDGPEDAVVQHLTNEQLLICVQQLNAEQQECIVLRFLHGLSVAETAAIMGKKDGAIKALQHRAVRRLAALLPEGLL